MYICRQQQVGARVWGIFSDFYIHAFFSCHTLKLVEHSEWLYACKLYPSPRTQKVKGTV
jgi:hypothetical protein